MNNRYKQCILLLVCSVLGLTLRAQFLMDMIDTTKVLGKGMLSVYKKFDHIRIGGYIQPQYQLASEPGVHTYSGGDFSKNSDNRFMLRRGRIRFDYAHLDSLGRPSFQFVFQFDGTERGVIIRDFWGRIWENKWESFAFTTGMFARPFGFEVNLSSSDRESPERGRMSQILMRTERDLGAMVTFEPRKSTSPLRFLRVEGGLFNGQGLTGPMEFDGFKDFIGQIVLKPVDLSNSLKLSAGVSVLYGGMLQTNKYTYRLQSDDNGSKNFIADSTTTVIGDEVPRHYAGVNGQLKWTNGWGATEIRGEYWQGTQTSLENLTETPGTIPELPNGEQVPFYVRKFDGAFFCLLQNIVNVKHQLGVKYDWYDPNSEVSGNEIGMSGNNLNPADLRYNTLGFGYLYYMNQNIKFTLWYEIVKTEPTQLPDPEGKRNYNILTCRLQFRF